MIFWFINVFVLIILYDKYIYINHYFIIHTILKIYTNHTQTLLFISTKLWNDYYSFVSAILWLGIPMSLQLVIFYSKHVAYSGMFMKKENLNCRLSKFMEILWILILTIKDTDLILCSSDI